MKLSTVRTFLNERLGLDALQALAHKKRVPIHGCSHFYYLGGITEGTETILLFVIVLLFPSWFPAAAYVYGTLCWLTTIGRIAAAAQRLR